MSYRWLSSARKLSRPSRCRVAAEAEPGAARVDEQRADPVLLVDRRHACDGDADLPAGRPVVVERHELRGALDIWRVAARLPVEPLGLRNSPCRHDGRYGRGDRTGRGKPPTAAARCIPHRIPSMIVGAARPNGATDGHVRRRPINSTPPSATGKARRKRVWTPHGRRVRDMTPHQAAPRFTTTPTRLWWHEQGITRLVAGVFEGGGAKGLLYRGALRGDARGGLLVRRGGGSLGRGDHRDRDRRRTATRRGRRETERGLDALRKPTNLSGLLRVRDGASYLDQDSLKTWLGDLLERQVHGPQRRAGRSTHHVRRAARADRAASSWTSSPSTSLGITGSSSTTC